MIISSSGYLAAVIGSWDSRAKSDSLLPDGYRHALQRAPRLYKYDVG
jgi:hypothetical protein